MPTPTQLSLSVELTRLLPYQSLINAVASSVLNLVRELQKSGSDAIVEEDLAAIFGRTRIETRFQSGFRTVVARHSSLPLNEFLGFTLESGAGPTVQRSLKKGAEQAYFSTAVQLSLLVSVYDIHSLTRGLRHALARRTQDIPSENMSVPDFDALFGTLQAIQDQTSSFNWKLILDAVHSKVFPHIGKQYPHTHHLSCHLPVAILQGCLDMFAIVQRFPDDRLLRISTSKHSLAEVLVVWSHHVLGLNVAVCTPDGGVYAKFGDTADNVIIVYQNDYYEEVNICLLEGSGEEIFRISQAIDDMEITSDQRLPSGGFGMRYLERKRIEIHELVVQHAIQSCYLWISGDDYSAIDCVWNLKDKLIHAARFLFPGYCELIADGNIDMTGLQPLSERDRGLEIRLGHLLLTFTCVVSLDGLRDLPLSVGALEYFPDQPPKTLRQPFENMKLLLLGANNVKNAVLVSSHGWSVYTNVLGFPDPSRVSLPLIHISPGVPSRGGERKRYIVDGTAPKNGCVTPSIIENEDPIRQPTLSCAFDVPTPRWYVGTTSRAFEVLITLELEPAHRSTPGAHPRCLKMLRVGLLRLEQSAAQVRRLSPCQHPENIIGSRLEVPEDCQTFSSECNFRLEKGSRKWIFMALSAGSSHARWFCLLDALDQAAGKNIYRGSKTEVVETYVRDQKTCFECAMDTIRRERQSRETSDSDHAEIVILIL